MTFVRSPTLPALEIESEAGNRDAQVLLAKLYAAGIGVDKNIKKADELLVCRPASSCVPGKDEYFLAMDFLDGAGVKLSYEEARYWLRVSSRRGYFPAEKKLNEIILEDNSTLKRKFHRK